ncbi:hypothetical protein Hanom_Chr10g00944651 [Helianthus anomalus]
MGLGLGWVGRGLAENAQVFTSGELGLGHGLRGGSFKPGVGWTSDPIWQAPIRLVVMS